MSTTVTQSGTIASVTVTVGRAVSITNANVNAAIADDPSATRDSLELGTLATQSGTFSGTSSGTNTGDQTITLTGDVTGSGTGSFAATLANTAVTAGSYTAPTITVDSKGRITAASSNSYAAEVHTHVSADITDATSNATPNTVVLRGSFGQASFANMQPGGTVPALSAVAKDVHSIEAESETAPGVIATSTAGLNHQEFGNAGDNRSFIRRVLGLIGWNRGSFSQTFGSTATLTANRAVELPDKSGTVAMIDSETHTGAHAFSSTTRPTSAGTGTPSSNSLITTADGDSRYMLLRSRLTSTVVVTNSTTYVNDCAITLPVGTYRIRSLNIVLNSSTTGLSKTRVNFSGTATATAPLTRRAFSTATDGASLAPNLLSQSNLSHAYTYEHVNFGTNRSMMIESEFEITVTVSGTLATQHAMNVASGAGDTATAVIGSYIEAMRIS